MFSNAVRFLQIFLYLADPRFSSTWFRSTPSMRLLGLCLYSPTAVTPAMSRMSRPFLARERLKPSRVDFPDRLCQSNSISCEVPYPDGASAQLCAAQNKIPRAGTFLHTFYPGLHQRLTTALRLRFHWARSLESRKFTLPVLSKLA